MMRSQTYEITFTGQAGATLRAEFDDCEVSIRPGMTTLRAELPDQGALTELVQRITGFGPVDGALQPGDTTQLLAMLRQALDLIGQHHTPSRIGITAGEDSLLTVVEAAPVAQAGDASTDVHAFTRLREQALQAGIGLQVELDPQGTRFTWHMPLGAARG